MTRHTTILAGRGARKRAVRVEHKRREMAANGAARDPLRLLGTVMVADALGFADEGLGGVMTGERLKALAGRKPASNVEAKSNVPAETSAEPIVMSAPGLLADDVCRHIWTARGRFAPILYGEGL